MIVIEFLEGQGLGNQLWNYFSGLGIAKVNQLEFRIAEIDKFKGKDFISLNADIYELNENNRVIEIHENLYDLKRESYISSYIDYKFWHLKGGYVYFIRGLFQSEEYFKSISNINDYISFSSSYLPRFKGKTVLNVRGGEYKRQRKFILPVSYWLNAISYLGQRPAAVITDDPGYAQKILPDLEIVSGIEASFMEMMHCGNCVVSNSTFSYWPLKLSSMQREIIAPARFARYNMSGLWCSWANAYKGWIYLDSDGKTIIYEEAVANIYEEYLEWQRTNYTVRERRITKIEKLKKLMPRSVLIKIRKCLNQ